MINHFNTNPIPQVTRPPGGGTTQIIKKNYAPNNQLHTEKSKAAITLCLYLYSARYTVPQMCKKFFCLNPVAMESAGENPKGNHNVHPTNQSHTEK